MKRRRGDPHWGFGARRKGRRVSCLRAAWLVSLLLGCSGGEPPPERGPTVVKVDLARVAALPDRREYVGNVRSIDRIEIRARVRGYLVEQAFEDGAHVERGTLLFRIEPAPFEVAVAEARGVLARAAAEASRAARDLERAEALFAQGVVSTDVIDARRADRDATAAAEQSAQAALRAAELDLSYATVRAPVAGRMGRALVDVGNLVGASGQDTVLAELVVEDPVRVYFAVPEGEAFAREFATATTPRNAPGGRAAVAGGDVGDASTRIAVQIALGDGTRHPHEGFVDYVAPTVDAERGTITLYAEVPNPGGELRPGQFVRVLLELPVPDTRRSVVVPERAVMDEQGGSYVLLVRADDTVERRAIETGRVVDGRQEVLRGLVGDERVIVEGVQAVRPGDVVSVEPIATAPARGDLAPRG